ncbi:hypothetical protein, partial [Falsiroseomonas oryzae]|uniref:hypothetical protein n=1 Tax=Falsiroseomonas oryzae TaxID=2766473 RepID=UPI0022EAFC49
MRRRRRLAVWRATLDARGARIAAAWDLPAGPVIAESPTARLVAIGADRVLKLAPPGQGVAAEIAALRAMQGR